MTHPQPIVPGPVSDFLAGVVLAAAQTERGKLSANRCAPGSDANAYRAGSAFRADSPTNPYGTGWRIVGE